MTDDNPDAIIGQGYAGSVPLFVWLARNRDTDLDDKISLEDYDD